MLVVWFVVFLVVFAIMVERSKMVLTIKNGHVELVKDMWGFQTRNSSTLKMFEQIPDPPDGVYHIWTGDVPVAGLLDYTKIPDFTFYSWPEAGLPIFYPDFYESIPPEFDTKKDRLLWIGAGTDDFEPRMHLYNTYKDYPDFEIIPLSKSTHKSMKEHSDYKYLLDIEGRGWSARLKFLLMLNSVVFIMDRPYVEYWHDEFEPWVHYVPVKRDASDLVEKFEKVKSMGPEDMARRCREKALEVFDKNTVYSNFKKILEEYNKGR